jgi:hypothetical protein
VVAQDDGRLSRPVAAGRKMAVQQRGTMVATIIDDVGTVFHNVLTWFQTLTPGGFGLILIPLLILGVVTILVSRKP